MLALVAMAWSATSCHPFQVGLHKVRRLVTAWMPVLTAMHSHTELALATPCQTSSVESDTLE